MQYFILDDDHNLVPVNDTLTWGKWFENAGEKRVVARTEIHGLRVSTVFLGIDMGVMVPQTSPEPEPLTFETMTFVGDSYGEIYMNRYPSWKEAEKGHYQAVIWAGPMPHPSTIYSDNSWQHPHYKGAEDHIFVIIHVAKDLFWCEALEKWIQCWQQSRTYTQEEAKDNGDHKPAEGRWYAIGRRIYL